ncbi:DUF885 family protein [Mangrovimonas sp. DI 80]|uniref:DUF885 domain-containing protein n=1 Tax=Mangrovimonas sp. DI 80 TaxID=1779330 RepID=UPI0009763FEF|nr:DUF885 domain-containing protein [Mangrovimonas sp. DI 80]OMP31863.1 hypothetical protein BKM32_02025 [Mangrovimonas sp. DI 80]
MKTLRLTLASLALISLAGCGEDKAQKDKTEFTVDLIKENSDKANAFFDKSFDLGLDRSPMEQSYLGIKKDYDKWDDISPEHLDESLEIAKTELQYAKDSIDPKALDTQTKLSYKLFVEGLEHNIADYKWRFYNYPVNQMHGMHSEIPSFLINIHSVADSSDAVAYISRLKGVEPLFDQLIKNLEIRETNGIVTPKFVFPRVIEDCKNIIKGAPFDTGSPSTLLNDFETKVNALTIADTNKAALINDAEEALKTSVKPGYDKLIAFLESQATRATTDDGCWKFPEGEAFYQNRLQRITTTNLTADEIHEIGLKEVARIHGEMKEIMKEVNFEGSLQDFFKFLKEDEQFYYPNTEEGKAEYIAKATDIINTMRGRLDDIFITKPKAEIQVKRVEAFRENSAGKAFYNSGTPDGSRPGTYYANLANTKNMPKFEMEALAYHEGIPGHHMDRSIAQELTGIPKFRKFGSYTAYVEGWGLYSEFIPKEMGFYEDPYSNYGRLAMELWRACRLVVDTGIHAKKWTRQEGIDYYMTNTSGSDRECVRMVERHIVMPGQATAYKIGMLKILELRKMAKEKLGDKFDLREFHEVVLTNGAVPLSVLEDLVNEWIASKE